MADPPDSPMQPSIVSQTLLDAEEAARRGDRQRAYQLSLKATQIAPENIKSWLLRVETTPSIEEAITCLNRANALQPLDSEAKQKTYRIVQRLIKEDPFLLYLSETDDWYEVRSGRQLSLIVPKDRSIQETHPARRPVLLQNAYRWLWMALFGLLIAGLGAMIFAPLAAVSAIGLYLKTPSKANSIHSLVLIIMAGGLWLFGLLLGVILLVHII